jgi:hypothetical protein
VFDFAGRLFSTLTTFVSPTDFFRRFFSSKVNLIIVNARIEAQIRKLTFVGQFLSLLVCLWLFLRKQLHLALILKCFQNLTFFGSQPG